LRTEVGYKAGIASGSTNLGNVALCEATRGAGKISGRLFALWPRAGRKLGLARAPQHLGRVATLEGDLGCAPVRCWRKPDAQP